MPNEFLKASTPLMARVFGDDVPAEVARRCSELQHDESIFREMLTQTPPDMAVALTSLRDLQKAEVGILLQLVERISTVKRCGSNNA